MERVSHIFENIPLDETSPVDNSWGGKLNFLEGALGATQPVWDPRTKILPVIEQNILNYPELVERYTTEDNDGRIYYDHQDDCRDDADDGNDFIRIIYYTEWVFTYSLMYSTDPYLNSVFLNMHRLLWEGFHQPGSYMGNYMSDEEDELPEEEYYNSHIEPDVLNHMFHYIKLSIRDIFLYCSRDDSVIRLLIQRGHLNDMVEHIFKMTFLNEEEDMPNMAENVLLVFQHVLQMDGITPLEYHRSIVPSV